MNLHAQVAVSTIAKLDAISVLGQCQCDPISKPAPIPKPVPTPKLVPTPQPVPKPVPEQDRKPVPNPTKRDRESQPKSWDKSLVCVPTFHGSIPINSTGISALGISIRDEKSDFSTIYNQPQVGGPQPSAETIFRRVWDWKLSEN